MHIHIMVITLYIRVTKMMGDDVHDNILAIPITFLRYNVFLLSLCIRIVI